MRAAREPYTLADWNSQIAPPNGWDVADAIADGWTPDEIKFFMRALLSDTLSYVPPPKPSSPKARAEPTAPTLPTNPAPAPKRRAVKGAAGVADIQAFSDGLQNGSDVELARLLAARIEQVCEGPAVMADGAFWAWGPTAWQQIEDRDLRMAVHQFDNVAISQSNKGLNVSSGKVDGVLRETGTILGNARFFDHPAVALNAINTVITIDGEGRIETRDHWRRSWPMRR